MHFSDITGKLGSNHIWRYFGLELINYILEMSRYTNIVYWKVFSTNIYRKIYFKSLLVFRYICWLVNCMSWVSKLNNFFWYAGKLRLDLYLRALILPFMESSFLTLQYFFCFFYLVCKLFKGLFQPLCQSVNFISWVFES